MEVRIFSAAPRKDVMLENREKNLKNEQILDFSIMGFTQIGIAIPNFWFAMLLVYLFAIILRWFSAGGFAGWEDGIILGLKSFLRNK